MIAVSPAAAPEETVTAPVLELTVMVLELLLQVTPWIVASEGARIASSVAVQPADRLMEPGATVTAVTDLQV